MKKLLIPLSLMTLAMLPAGCMTKDNSASVTKTLSNNITELMESAKRVSDIDESKLKINELQDKTDINSDYKTQNDGSYKNKTIRKLVRNNDKVNSSAYDKYTTFRYNNINNGSSYSKYIGNNTTYNKNSVNNSNTNNTQQTDNYISDSGQYTNKNSTAEYNPRFTDSTQNVALTNYIEKIQDLYTICNDTCAASYDLDGLKNELLKTCTNCNNLLQKIKSGEVTLTQEQQNTLSEYNNTLQGCINDLNSCKNCSEDVNIINTLKGNFSNNCDTLVAKYLKVLNNLDINGSYCNNAQCTVAEINNYISSICGENVNNYVSRYKFDSYAIEDNSSQKQNNTSNNLDNNSNNASNNNQKVDKKLSQNSSNNAQNTTQNTQQSNVVTNTQNTTKTQNNTQNQNGNNQVKTNQSTPSRQITPVYTQTNNQQIQKNQTNQNRASNNQNNVNRQNNSTTYPMPRPVNNRATNNTPNQSRPNTYGGNTPKTLPEYDTPNRHPLTKDIKQNPNRQTSQNNQQANEVVTYNNRYNDSFAVSTPSPKAEYKGVSAQNSQPDKNTDFRTDNRKVYSRPSFTNHQMMFGPQDVRANNNIMTLEEI